MATPICALFWVHHPLATSGFDKKQQYQQGHNHAHMFEHPLLPYYVIYHEKS
ncbi:hypothetical protein VIF_002024 [Vibrio cholerae TM 11079-80]|nr:hypothetical protein VIF_002024 [Vibrio cholerae TM 11079-80]